MSDHDAVLVGGGLANALAVLALRQRWPRLRLALVEAAASLGGNHTWCFHGPDLGDDARALVGPLVTQRWPAVTVAFPGHQRRLPTSYHRLEPAVLDRAVRSALETPGSALLLRARARRITPDEVELEDGRRLAAPLILDGRGPTPPSAHAEATAYQKFVGLEVEVDRDRGDGVPLLMDARVAQLDGFRFMYVLPFGRRHLLVEDTCFSDSPALDAAAARERIAGYLRGHGQTITRVIREEAGCLPLPLEPRGQPPLGSPVRLGYLGGWLHPTTGYSLPLAAEVAVTLARHGVEAALPPLGRLYQRVQRQARFGVRLNRLLFRTVAPADRVAVMERFYRLPVATIERFYALASTPMDRARILCGRPPRGLTWTAALAAAEAI
jgi:lycopene beta-cyclase